MKPVLKGFVCVRSLQAKVEEAHRALMEVTRCNTERLVSMTSLIDQKRELEHRLNARQKKTVKLESMMLLYLSVQKKSIKKKVVVVVFVALELSFLFQIDVKMQQNINTGSVTSSTCRGRHLLATFKPTIVGGRNELFPSC